MRLELAEWALALHLILSLPKLVRKMNRKRPSWPLFAIDYEHGLSEGIREA